MSWRWCIAVYALCWAPAALGERWTFAVHDLRLQHLPWRLWAAREWAAGRIPLWHEGLGLGFPLMADGQTGVWYAPGLLPFVFLPPDQAVDICILGHQAWAALGAAELARCLGRSAPAALVAGLLWGYGGLASSHGLYLGMLAALSWWPWMLLCLRRGWWRRGALCVGALWTAGHPQAALLGSLLALIWGLAGPLRGPRLPRFGAMAGAALLGLGLACPQLVATWELVGRSARAGGLDALAAGVGSLPPLELVNLALPDLFGLERPLDIPTSGLHKGLRYWGRGEAWWEMCLYLVLPALGLAAMARWSAFWRGLCAIALLLMLGRATPLWELLRALPGLDALRFPVRFGGWLLLALALLAAAGLDRRGRGRGAGLVLLLLPLLGAGVAGLAHGWLQGEGPRLEAALTERLGARGPDPLGLDGAARARQVVEGALAATEPTGPTWRRATWTGTGAGALLLGGAGRWPLALWVAADLRAFGGEVVGLAPAEGLRAPPAVAAELAGRGRVGIFDRHLPVELELAAPSASLGAAWGLADVLVPSPLALPEQSAFVDGLGLGLDLAEPAERQARLAAAGGRLDLIGLQSVLSQRALEVPGLVEVPSAGPLRRYDNPDALPFLSWLPCAAPLPEHAEGLEALELGRVVALEGAAPACPGEGAEARLRLERRAPAEWALEVESARPGWIRLQQAWDPGWRLEGSSGDLELLPGEGLVLAAELPAGRHPLRLRYAPAWLRPSLAVALAAALVLAVGSRGAAGLRQLSARRPRSAPAG